MIYLITATCLQFPSTYNAACNSALTATTMQLGIKQRSDELQVRAEKDAEALAERTVGRKASTIIVAYFGYISTNQLVVNAPIRPIADNLNVVAIPTTGSYNVGLTWAF